MEVEMGMEIQKLWPANNNSGCQWLEWWYWRFLQLLFSRSLVACCSALGVRCSMFGVSCSLFRVYVSAAAAAALALLAASALCRLACSPVATAIRRCCRCLPMPIRMRTTNGGRSFAFGPTCWRYCYLLLFGPSKPKQTTLAGHNQPGRVRGRDDR